MATPTLFSGTIALGNLLQVRTYCTFRSQVAINTFYYEVFTLTEPGVDLAAVAAFFGARFFAAYQPWLTNGATFAGTGVKALVTLVPKVAFSQPAYDITASGAGTGGTSPLPTQDAGISSIGTSVAGPSGRGRTYWPFPDHSKIDNTTGLFSAAAIVLLSALQDAQVDQANSYFMVHSFAGPGSTTFVPVLYAYGATQFRYVSTSVVRSGIATQRRRGTNFGRTNSLPF